MQTQINDLKDYAELAQASYFYFDLDGYMLNENDTKITTSEIISLKYNGKVAGEKEKIGKEYHFVSKKKLNGKFSEIQASNFAKRYKIYFHQANTASGFSATLFYDAQKDRFVVGFRGTERLFYNFNDWLQDIALTANFNSQSSALLDFLIKVDKIIRHYNKRLIFIGHSLGGYLAQIAFIYCDSLYKDKFRFSPSEVYTFNAPSIHGWISPSLKINPNTIKILQEILDKRSIDISQKITHIYNSSGIKLIASAQYGASNRIPINTSKDSHSIIALIQTLYFYSYILKLESNYSKIKNKSLDKCIEYLNDFMQGIYKIFNPLSMSINKENTKTQTNESNTATLHLDYLPQVKPNDIDCLLAFIEHILYVTSLEIEIKNIYIKLHSNKDNIIDKIIILDSKGYYPRILDKQDIYKLDSKQCSIAEKRAIFKCQPFVIVDENDREILHKDNIAKLFRYNSNSTIVILYNTENHHIFFDARISMMKNILYNDKMYVSYIKEIQA